METKPTSTPAPATKQGFMDVASWAKKVGLTPKAARRQLRAGSIAGATKDGGEWEVPQDAKPAERKAKESKPAAKSGKASNKPAAKPAKAAKKITVKKVSKTPKGAFAGQD